MKDKWVPASKIKPAQVAEDESCVPVSAAEFQRVLKIVNSAAPAPRLKAALQQTAVWDE